MEVPLYALLQYSYSIQLQFYYVNSYTMIATFDYVGVELEVHVWDGYYNYNYYLISYEYCYIYIVAYLLHVVVCSW